MQQVYNQRNNKKIYFYNFQLIEKDKDKKKTKFQNLKQFISFAFK